MLPFLISLQISVAYGIPVQPLSYYKWAFQFSIDYKYLTGSYFYVGSRGSGSYRFTSISAGGKYRWKFLSASLGAALIDRSGLYGSELGIAPYLSSGIEVGGDYGVFLGLKMFLGKNNNLSFLLFGATFEFENY